MVKLSLVVVYLSMLVGTNGQANVGVSIIDSDGKQTPVKNQSIKNQAIVNQSDINQTTARQSNSNQSTVNQSTTKKAADQNNYFILEPTHKIDLKKFEGQEDVVTSKYMRDQELIKQANKAYEENKLAKIIDRYVDYLDKHPKVVHEVKYDSLEGRLQNKRAMEDIEETLNYGKSTTTTATMSTSQLFVDYSDLLMMTVPPSAINLGADYRELLPSDADEEEADNAAIVGEI